MERMATTDVGLKRETKWRKNVSGRRTVAEVPASERCCYQFFGDDDSCPNRATHQDEYVSMLKWCPKHAHPGESRVTTRKKESDVNSDRV